MISLAYQGHCAKTTHKNHHQQITIHNIITYKPHSSYIIHVQHWKFIIHTTSIFVLLSLTLPLTYHYCRPISFPIYHIWLMHDVIIHLFYFSLSDQPIERTLQTPINLHSINRAVNATLTRLIILPSYAQYVHRADSAPSLDRMLQLRPTSAAIARSARSPSRTLPSDQRTSLGTLL